MEWLEIAGILAVCIVISFIAMKVWILFWDSIIGGIKKILGIGKKKEINWHTLDKNQETKTDIEIKKSDIEANERLY